MIPDILEPSGVAVLPGWLEPAEVRGLREEIDRYLAGLIAVEAPPDGSPDLASAIDMPHLNGPAALALATEQRVLDLVAAVSGETGPPRLLTSMYYLKRPGQRGQPWHQDAYFASPGVERVLTCWFALDRADAASGCLRVAARRADRLLSTEYTTDLAEHVLTHEIRPDERAWAEASSDLLEVEAGTAVVLDGLLPHESSRNTGERARRALVLHYGIGGARTLAPPDETRERPSLRCDPSTRRELGGGRRRSAAGER